MLQLLSNNKGDHIIFVLGAKFFNVLLIVGNTLELWVFCYLIDFFIKKGHYFQTPLLWFNIYVFIYFIGF